MTITIWIKEKLKTISDHTKLYNMYEKCIDETGSMMEKDTYKRLIRKLKDNDIEIMQKKLNTPEIKIEENENEKNIEIKSSDIKTKEQLLKYAKIDTNIWNVEKCTVNTWGNEENRNYQIKCWLKKKIFNFNDIKQQMIEDMIHHAPRTYTKIKRKKKKNACMLEIAIHDLHFGQLSWNKETGYDNYDIKIAEELLLECVNYFIDVTSHFSIEKILFPIGSDFFNVNNAAKTTAAGTSQDEDCRWQKSFLKGRQLLVRVLDYLRNIADVDVLVIPGNHDFERSFYLGDALYCWYHNDTCVTVNNDPMIRKYYKYYKNLIGLTHGHDIKNNKLPLLMPIEAEKLWGDTLYREWHIGHLHHTRTRIYEPVLEENGIKVRIIPSIVAIDAWHKLKGYNSVREAQAFIWDKNKGNIAQFNYHI